MKKAAAAFLMIWSFFCQASAGPATKSPIAWLPWTDDLFERATREHRLVLLDLEAIWCHWCHVMDEKTYTDPAVVKLIQDHYLAVKVDQDSRPDLANRYEDFGWPATIVFDSAGKDLAKRSGYIPPDSMAKMLETFWKDPTPGPSAKPEPEIAFSEKAVLSDAQRAALQKSHDDLYDQKNVGWGGTLKFLEWRSVEYAMVKAHAGDAQEKDRLVATIDKERLLIDPVWGGVYQYSEGSVWTKPHFEKIMQYQAENIRMFALAATLGQSEKNLSSATGVYRFAKKFLTDASGAFYTSMDADQVQGEHSGEYFELNDEQRRAKGVPRIDQNIYARENGWMIQALCQFFAASGRPALLEDAQKADAWITKNRGIEGGGFRHGEKDTGGPFLADTLSMARAKLALYQVTADRTYLAAAEKALAFMTGKFPLPGDRGFASTRDEMTDLARFANLLYQHTGEAKHKEAADRAMRFVTAKGVADKLPTAGVLLAEVDLTRDPTHVTVVGPKTDANARALFLAALQYPATYKRVEWWDKAEGPLRRMDVSYPEVKGSAAFACTDKRCSLPIRKPEDVVSKVEQLKK